MNLKELPPGIHLLNTEQLVKRTHNLTRIRRDKEVLFIERETASWMVLSEAELELFNSLHTPRKVADILNHPPTSLSVREKEELLLKLFKNQMITLNGKGFYSPEKLWTPPPIAPAFLCLHITNACNFTCKYCYAKATLHKKLMPFEISSRVVERAIEEIPKDFLLIDFHGGEPFMAYDNMVKTILHAREYKKKRGIKKQLKFVVMTNGSLLTPQRFKTLQELDCAVGVSLDGPAEIHDINRIYPDGSGTHEQIMKNLEELQQQGHYVGSLSVVHRPENYLRIFKYFLEDLNRKNFRINYSAYIGRATEELEFPHGRGETFARYYIEMVDYAIAHVKQTGERLLVKDLANQLNNITTKDRPFMCYRSPCGCGNSILGFGHDGGIYACEEAVGVPEFLLGNILDDSQNIIQMLENSETLKMINSRTVENIPRCRQCAFKRICSGRCTTKSFARYRSFLREDAMCRFYQTIFPALMWRVHDYPDIMEKMNLQGRKTPTCKGNINNGYSKEMKE